MRDIYQNPRVGDRVQLHSIFGTYLPEPLVITQVTSDQVAWHRPGSDQRGMLAIELWRNPRSFRLELLEPAVAADKDQADMIGGAA